MHTVAVVLVTFVSMGFATALQTIDERGPFEHGRAPLTIAAAPEESPEQAPATIPPQDTAKRTRLTKLELTAEQRRKIGESVAQSLYYPRPPRLTIVAGADSQGTISVCGYEEEQTPFGTYINRTPFYGFLLKGVPTTPETTASGAIAHATPPVSYLFINMSAITYLLAEARGDKSRGYQRVLATCHEWGLDP